MIKAPLGLLSCVRDTPQLLRMQQEDGLEDLASYFVTERKQNSDKVY